MWPSQKKALEIERSALKEKQKEARQAHKTKEKFVQLQQQEVAEKSRERQYKEELEQEEFRTVDII